MHFSAQDPNKNSTSVNSNQKQTLEQLIAEVASGTEDSPHTSSPAPSPKSTEPKTAALDTVQPAAPRLNALGAALGYRAPVSGRARINTSDPTAYAKKMPTPDEKEGDSKKKTDELPLYPNRLMTRSETPLKQGKTAPAAGGEAPIAIPVEIAESSSPEYEVVISQQPSQSQTPQAIVEGMMLDETDHATTFAYLKQFLQENAHNPLIETESGTIAFVGAEEGVNHLRVYIGTMTNFCLMTLDDEIEGQLIIDEVFEFDEEPDNALVVIRKSSQQLAPSVAGRKTFLVLDFKGFVCAGNNATHSLRKEWH